MCDVPRCRKKDHEYTYYGHEICSRCAELHDDGKLDLKAVLKIDDEPRDIEERKQEDQSKISNFC